MARTLWMEAGGMELIDTGLLFGRGNRTDGRVLTQAQCSCRDACCLAARAPKDTTPWPSLMNPPRILRTTMCASR